MPLRGLAILVVGIDSDSREITGKMLKALGAMVVVADDGTNAFGQRGAAPHRQCQVHGHPSERLPHQPPGCPVEHDFPPGESPVPLVSFVVPGDAPNGAYIVEAALLDPDRGVTLARRSMKVVKQ
jgi:5-enolpyruvylshikimate-3-phosphate synthase